MRGVNKYPLYVISGISGSGKTTIGRRLMCVVDGVNSVFVDQDQFYIEDKPMVTLSNGVTVKNWDDTDALNPKMATIVDAMLDHAPVVLVGFSLTEAVLGELKPAVHIHLVTARSPQLLQERCKRARMQTKLGADEELNALMVDEVVIPHYRETVRNSEITHLVYVYDDETGNRRPIAELVTQILDIVNTDMGRMTRRYLDVAEPYHTLIYLGEKPVEGRKISPTWSKVHKGDELIIGCGVDPALIDTAPHGHGDGHVFTARVTGIHLYLPCLGDPLGRYLEEETLARALPNVQSLDEGRAVYLQWSSQTDIDRLGMMGIQLQVPH
jgi:ASC-1-like (ASCH) protein/shikimate kinase